MLPVLWEGLYKSTNGGNEWILLPYPETDPVDQIELVPGSSEFLYSNYHNLSKSTDGGQTWIEIGEAFGEIGACSVFKIDPENTDYIYAAINKFDGSGGTCLQVGKRWNQLEQYFGEPA